jgi:hypothetical protein
MTPTERIQQTRENMKTTMKIEKEVDVKILSVQAHVRYWEDGEIDGEQDTKGNLTPCRQHECWCPEIDVDSGMILNWKQGVKASIHYKVCDEGVYKLKDSQGNVLAEKDGYVPSCMSPKESGYGDYIIMDIDENGQIQDWSFDVNDLGDFNEDE